MTPNKRAMVMKVATTFGLIALFRVGAALPSPGLDPRTLQQLDSSDSFSSPMLLQLPGVELYSLFGLGLAPYLGAMILISLLGRSIGPITTMASAVGSQAELRYRRMIRLVAHVIAAATSIGNALRELPTGHLPLTPGLLPLLAHVVVQVAGFSILLALANAATKAGWANGISTILVATTAAQALSAYHHHSGWNAANLSAFAIALAVSVMILAVAHGSKRDLVVHDVRPDTSGSRRSGHRSFKVASGGAGPVLFAGSAMAALHSLVSVLPGQPAARTEQWAGGNSMSKLVAMSVLVVLFARAYASIGFDALQAANQTTRSGRFLDNTTPGLATARLFSSASAAAGWWYALALTPLLAVGLVGRFWDGLAAAEPMLGFHLVVPVLILAELSLPLVRRVSQRGARP